MSFPIKSISVFIASASLLAFSAGCTSLERKPAHLELDGLSAEHISQVKTLVKKLEPFIQTKDRQGALPTLTFDELESPLNSRQIQLLHAFRDLRAREIGVKIPYKGFSEGKTPLIRLGGQKIRIKGVEKELLPQFLSPPVYKAYQTMMTAMERDIGKKLYVESAYRSSAHQLYLFIYYLGNHAYSIRETAQWVALPGYSEHGDPRHLAIDFINADGINGEGNVTAFEILPEYQWLLLNAGQYGFVLSYPKNASPGITYEPWHWRYNGSQKSSLS
jgi:hypothetical protein